MSADVGAALAALSEALQRELPRQDAELAVQLATAAFRRQDHSAFEGRQLQRRVQQIREALEAIRAPVDDAPRIWTSAGEDTDGAAVTLLHVHVLDGPFVHSTLVEELQRLGFEARDLAHPVFGAVRDDAGRLIGIEPARTASSRETYLVFDLGTELNAEVAADVRDQLAAALQDAQLAVRDFRAMKERIRAGIEDTAERAPARFPPDEVDEVVSLLRWLLDDHFVILGYREYQLVEDDGERRVAVVPGSGMGILSAEERSSYAAGVRWKELDERVRARFEGPLLLVSRTNRTSTVHRHVRMVYVGVAVVSAEGRIVGERRILGLFAQKAFVEPSSTIPVLRSKLREILAAEDVVDHSSDERALRTLFDALPKLDLFESDLDSLRHTLIQLLEVSRRGEVRLLLRPEPTGRSLAALVTLPRERFSAELRQEIQALLVERTGAEAVDYQMALTERDQPLLHFTIHMPVGREPEAVDAAAIEDEIVRLARTWKDALIEALAAQRGAEAARQTARVWCAVFPAGYTETTTVGTAVQDIEALESLSGPDAVEMRLVRTVSATAGPQRSQRLPSPLRFRLYKAGPGVEVSVFLPILESLGLTVVEEMPFAIDDSPVWDELHIHDYGVRSELVDVDVERDGPRVAAAAMALWHGRAEVDALNRLVLVAAMTWQDVAILRAYRRYQRQVGTTFTERYTNAALVENATVTTALLAYFRARFGPDSTRDQVEARDAVLASLDAVERLDIDRILRSFLGLIDATTRTNAFTDAPRISFKLDSSAVPGIPKPVPYREIFVYTPEVEGVHLRGGPVARGGVRWSDRVDDFRTEILGLMKAQMTKNALIVPVGSKGGFVLKEAGDDPRTQLQRTYETFVRGLLDVTDNVVGDQVVAPDRVVRHDGDDPYLVVAADRGTATFSDLANSISDDYGFWLGDAFASGGSQGYDHKAMGITARGAWVAVQRHFRELDVDVQTEPVRVVGVGDMSGDVFGNGMLRSRTIRLVAAFDHRDVFVDPEPDPERSFQERQRLFDTPRSSWQDYNRELISAGGGVWSRTTKAITISAQMKEALRVDADQLSPPELVRVILRAPVDLLWFGGIGTFVKAPDETHADVGDRANDGVRIDADELGARVVGEGGNLAMTQRGRITYARRGGRCNTDAVDNAAGVDTSDREVNLKILLRMAVESGRLTTAERDEQLREMTADVAAAVLRDIYLQTWAISAEIARAPGGLGAYEQFMARLEEQGRLDRGLEVLPATAEIERRRKAAASLTRPELSVLICYAKNHLTDNLVASDMVDQEAFRVLLDDYFPPLAVERHTDLIPRHRLRRELIATVLANDCINRMGITWPSRTAADLGVSAPDVTGAYWVAREVIGAARLWSRIEALDGRCDAGLQLELLTEVQQLLDANTRSFIRQDRHADVARSIAEDEPAFGEVLDCLDATSTPAQRAARQNRAERWMDLGIDTDLAEDLAALADLDLAPGIAATARASGRSVRHCAEVYALVAEALPLDPVSAMLQDYAAHGRWERWQHRGLLDDLRRVHHTAARQAIGEHPDADPRATVDAYLAARDDPVQRARALAREAVSHADDLNAIAVAVRALQEIVL